LEEGNVADSTVEGPTIGPPEAPVVGEVALFYGLAELT